MKYKHIVFALEGTVIDAESIFSQGSMFDGVKSTIKELKNRGFNLGIIILKSKEYYKKVVVNEYIENTICTEDCFSDNDNRILEYINKYRVKKEELLFIGSTSEDKECAKEAGVDFALALWRDIPHRHMRADYYLNQPYEIVNLLDKNVDGLKDKPWLKWAIELQFIAQAGLTYSKEVFDIERFERIRDISAEILSMKTELSLEKVKELFCNEEGFQTPKVDTRAAIFQENEILLVKEKNGLWSLPGGWVDINQSIKSNTIKEVREEAGLEVIPVKLIAVHDRNLHNRPLYAYSIFKHFVLCEIVGGSFKKNSETEDSGFFPLDKLPQLSTAKNSEEQVKMCFEAHNNKNWETIFD